jgi:DNA-binding transcriptional LysR family regulator
MTLDQLRVFVTVAEQLHVTKAALVLNMTQSAASASIAALEARCKAKLFNRVGRTIELTLAGRLFLVEAKAVLARVEQAEFVLDELSGLKRGKLKLYASQTIASYWLPAYLHRFRALYPQVTLELAIGNTSQAAQAVVAGTADLGFIEGEANDPALVRLPVPGDRLVLVAAPDHPLSRLKRPSAHELANAPWVLREPGSGTRQIFEAALQDYGIDVSQLNVILELPSNEAVRSAVEAGAGASVISRLVVNSSLNAGALKLLEFPFPQRRFFAIRHIGRQRGNAEEALLSLIRPQQP